MEDRLWTGHSWQTLRWTSDAALCPRLPPDHSSSSVWEKYQKHRLSCEQKMQEKKISHTHKPQPQRTKAHTHTQDGHFPFRQSDSSVSEKNQQRQKRRSPEQQRNICFNHRVNSGVVHKLGIVLRVCEWSWAKRRTNHYPILTCQWMFKQPVLYSMMANMLYGNCDNLRKIWKRSQLGRRGECMKNYSGGCRVVS